MCGISGSLAAGRVLPQHIDFVEQAVRMQFRRGPDHQAIQVVRELGPGIIFGHNRLSIIDISAAANQPFWSTDGRYCVTFNGEIYNYLELRQELQERGRRFRTTSDTEVLVEAWAEWGTAAIERLNGMFAFAMADVQTGKLWLVRDRFGVKPLHYALRSDGELFFASSATVIARSFELAPNPEYLGDGIQWLIYEDGSPRTQYVGLNSVEAGTYLECEVIRGEVKHQVSRYYHLAKRVEERVQELNGSGEQELIRLTEDTLRHAVKIRLRSDVPVGVSLSGGMDSSLVASLAKLEGGDIVGVSFGNPDRHDTEGPRVREIEKHLGMKIEYVWPEPPEMEAAAWETLEAQEAPYPSLSVPAQFMVFNMARRTGLKVMLGGQGADETFMGYRKYLYMTLMRRERMTGVLGDSFGLFCVAARELHRMVQNLDDARRYFYPARLALNLPSRARHLGLDGFKHVRNRQMQDVTEVSLPTLLRYEDRNSMGNSVESRLPFMDYRLVEIGLALPNRLKVRNGYGKWILRQIAQKYLPPVITENRIKIGFDATTGAWIDGCLGNSIRTRLHEPFSAGLINNPPDVHGRYSDFRLARNGDSLSEALTAIWLSDRVSASATGEAGCKVPLQVASNC